MTNIEEDTPDDGSRPVVTAFIDEIERVIGYFAKEFKITHAEVAGCLEIVKASFLQQRIFKDSEKEEEE